MGGNSSKPEEVVEDSGADGVQTPSKRLEEGDNLVEFMERLEKQKEEVISIVYDCVHNWNLLSPTTKEPLSDDEKIQYLCSAICYLEMEEKEHYKTEGNAIILPPAFRTILTLDRLGEQHFDALKAHLENICQSISSHCKEAYNERWRKTWENVRSQETAEPEENKEEAEPSPLINKKNAEVPKLPSKLPINGLAALSGYLGGFGPVSKSIVQNAMDETALALTGRSMTHVKATGIASIVYMGGVVAWNLGKVWKCGRSWKRCGKNIVDELGCLTAGAVAGLAATAMTSFLGPFSFFIGIGVGIASSLMSRPRIQKLTCEEFNLPESETLEKAFLAIGVECNAKDGVVGRAYRNKSRMYHPDAFSSRHPHATQKERDANHRKFLRIQAAIDMIRAFREGNEVDYENAKINFTKIQEELKEPRLGMNHSLRRMIESIRSRIPFQYLMVGRTKLAAIGYGVLPYAMFEESSSTEPVPPS